MFYIPVLVSSSSLQHKTMTLYRQSDRTPLAGGSAQWLNTAGLRLFHSFIKRHLIEIEMVPVQQFYSSIQLSMIKFLEVIF